MPHFCSFVSVAGLVVDGQVSVAGLVVDWQVSVARFVVDWQVSVTGLVVDGQVSVAGLVVDWQVSVAGLVVEWQVSVARLAVDWPVSGWLIIEKCLLLGWLLFTSVCYQVSCWLTSVRCRVGCWLTSFCCRAGCWLMLPGWLLIDKCLSPGWLLIDKCMLPGWSFIDKCRLQGWLLIVGRLCLSFVLKICWMGCVDCRSSGVDCRRLWSSLLLIADCLVSVVGYRLSAVGVCCLPKIWLSVPSSGLQMEITSIIITFIQLLIQRLFLIMRMGKRESWACAALSKAGFFPPFFPPLLLNHFPAPVPSYPAPPDRWWFSNSSQPQFPFTTFPTALCVFSVRECMWGLRSLIYCSYSTYCIKNEEAS